MNAVPHQSRVARREAQRRQLRNRRIAAACALAVILAFGGYAAFTVGRVMPGVSVAGVDVGARGRADAQSALQQAFATRMAQPLTVHADGHTATVVPARLGIGIDVKASISRALGQDRLSGRLLPFLRSADVAPVVRAPKTIELPKSLRHALKAPRDATISLDPKGQVTITPSRAGTGFDPSSTSQAIVAAVFAGRSDVTLTAISTAATLSTAAAKTAAARVHTIISKPIRLTVSGGSAGVLRGARLAPLLQIRPHGSSFGVSLDQKGLERALSPIQKRLGDAPQNATWTTDGSKATLVPARPGRGIDLVATMPAILAAATSSGSREAELAIHTTQPSLTTAKAKTLGISERVASATTSLGSSTPNRVHNVELMAGTLNGQIIAPGATFSFNDAVGERTAARGYLEGQEIVNGLLIPSIGGGVCQAATSIYDAALDGGYAIVSRTNHSFFLSHYGAGLDATVSWGGPDFEFRNDSPYSILIKTRADNATMTVNLYSTSRGYTTTLTTGPETKPTTPTDRYVLDKTLPAKTSQLQTLGEGGFDVTLNRVVRHDGTIVKQDSFASHYTPEDKIYYVGTGFKVPAGHSLEALPTDGT